MASYISKAKEEFAERVQFFDGEGTVDKEKNKMPESCQAPEHGGENDPDFGKKLVSSAENKGMKVLVLDPDALILYASTAVLKLLRANSWEQLIGYSFLALFTPRDAFWVRNKINDVCIEKETKKINDIRLATSTMPRMNMELFPVEYMNRPAVKVLIGSHLPSAIKNF